MTEVQEVERENMPPQVGPSDGAEGEKKKKKKKKVPKQVQSVFESQPATSRADVGHGGYADPTANLAAPSTFESCPKASRADVGHASQGLSTSAAQSVFESAPITSKADVNEKSG